MGVAVLRRLPVPVLRDLAASHGLTAALAACDGNSVQARHSARLAARAALVLLELVPTGRD